MKRALPLLVSLALGGGCTSSTPLGDRLLRVGEEAATEARQEPPTFRDARGAVSVLAQLARDHVHDGVEPLEAVRMAVFDDSKFTAVYQANDLRGMLLPTVLRDQRGTCLGLAQVYLAVAERLGLPLHAVVVPGHVFVRAPGPPAIDVELLRRGIQRSDAFYRSTFAVPDGVAAYMRELGDDELVGLVHYNLGNAAREQGVLDRALAHATRAVRLFDDFPEAHAARGLVFQLRGELHDAEVAYARARALYPALPGLDANERALAGARGGRRPPEGQSAGDSPVQPPSATATGAKGTQHSGPSPSQAP